MTAERTRGVVGAWGYHAPSCTVSAEPRDDNGRERGSSIERNVASYWAFLARMHRNGVLYLVVPFSFALILNLLVPEFRFYAYEWFGVWASWSLGFAELAAYYLSIPLLFAVLNPSGILRGLATASLGFALAAFGTRPPVPLADPRYVSDPWFSGLPVDPVFSGLFVLPIGAALALAGYRGKWGIPLSLTRMRRVLLLVTGSVLMVFAIADTVFEEDIWLAIALMIAFTCVGLLMQRYAWPRWPLFAGFMFGTLVERNFIDALTRYELFSALGRPIPLGLAAMILVTAGFAYCLRRSSTASAETGTTTFRQPLSVALLHQRNIMPVLGIATGAAFWLGSFGFGDIYIWFLPRVAGLAATVLCLLELVRSMREPVANIIPKEDARG